MAKKPASKKTKTSQRFNWQGKKVALQNLRTWNIVMGLVLALQGAVLLVISNSASMPVNNMYLSKDSLASQAAGKTVLAPAQHLLFDLRLSYIIAAFLFAAAVIQLLAATRLRKLYESNLKAKTNRLRWLGYALSGGLALITIALINGVSDIATLLAIFALTEILALFCVLVESVKDLGKHPRVTTKLPFVAGITPWLITAIYLFGSRIYGNPGLPIYVYILDATIFVLFLKKAGVMWLSGHNKGKFADYLYTERAYMVINFVLLSALAWQVYGSALHK